MAKTPKTAQTYKQLISQTNEEVAAEQLDYKVEQAANQFEQGVLSVKGKMITASSKLKESESKVKTAEKALQNAKKSEPAWLVQNLINAKVAVKQANLDLQSAQEAYNDLKELYEFLETTKKVLFSFFIFS